MVADWTTPAEGSSQFTTSVSWTGRNDGDATAAASWTDTVYLSADEVCCTGDTAVSNLGQSTAIAPGATYSKTRTITIPSVAPGAYHLLVKLDSGNQKAEENEGNNVQGAPFTLRVPDLQPVALTAPTDGTAGTPVIVSWNVTNHGDGTAKGGVWADWFYLSTDAVCCAGDVAIAGVAHATDLAPGADYVAAATITLPERPAGEYRLFVVADATDALWENGGQVDNQLSVPLTLRVPDLVPVSFTAPSEGIAGETLEVTFEVRNQGDGFADANWVDRVWLSSDTVCCTGDAEFLIPHPTAAIPAHSHSTDVPAGGNYTVSVELVAPNRVSGEYHILFKTDSHTGQPVPGYVYEGNETNNVAAPLPFRLYAADLVPDRLEVQAVASSADTLWVNYTGRNAGDGTAVGFWWDSFSFSQQTNCCPQNGFQRLGKVKNNVNLTAGDSYTRNVTLTVFDEVAQVPGTYRLFLQLDKEQDFPTMPNNVIEPNAEGNNWLSTEFTVVIPDLVPTDFAAPASAKKGQVINLTWAAENVGEGRAAVDWFDQVSLKPTPPGYANAGLVDEWTRDPLEPGASYSRARTMTLPQWPPGLYTLNLSLDRFNTVPEYGGTPAGPNPANNHLLRTIAINLPDLQVSAATAPALATGNATFEVTWTTRNDGSEKAVAPWKDAVYFSTDAVLDPGDTRLGEVSHATNLTDGAGRDAALSVTLPGLATGDHHLLVVTDDSRNVGEGYEANNVRVLALRVDDDVPETTLTAAPSGPVNTAEALLTFEANEAATFTCTLDGLAEACTSPWALEALPEGEHAFEVFAADLAGNVDPTPATASWTVDTQPPETTLTAFPGPLVNTAQATLAFEATEEATFQCTLDGVLDACTSPRALAGLAEGPHTFAVRATDLAGNVEAEGASVTWTVDTVPPETSLLHAPGALVNVSAASFDFEASEAATFTCTLDGAASPCTSPLALVGLADGAHAFEVAATDLAGNPDPTPAAWAWTVDTTPPETSLLDGPAALVNVTSASFPFEANEAGARRYGSVEALGTVSERAPVGYRPRGLQRERGLLELLLPRPGALARLPLG